MYPAYNNYMRAASEDETEAYLRHKLVGVRVCPYGICCPWMPEGWGLDAVGTILRRRLLGTRLFSTY